MNLYKLLWVNDQIAELEARLLTLDDHVGERLFTRHEADLLKSSLEVSPELIKEFNEWKARKPVPENPLVSVCIATYNRARLLTERSIPSILNQTYNNLELIVVGDGCTDETEELVSGIRDPRLKFINLPERGLYPEEPLRRWLVAGTQAINKAMSLAVGDYVTHLDDDDEHLPGRLEKLVRFVSENRCDFVWHPFWWEKELDQWTLHEALNFASGEVTTSAVFYRSWFTKIEWNVDAHLLMEPGDWNRFRRIKYLNPVCMRYPEPLLKHYRERTQHFK